MSPSLLFSQRITNLVWNRCRSAQSLSVELGFWISIVIGIPGFLEQYSGFQSPRFRIPQAKCSRIPDSTCKNFTDSTIRILLHGANSQKVNDTDVIILLFLYHPLAGAFPEASEPILLRCFGITDWRKGRSYPFCEDEINELLPRRLSKNRRKYPQTYDNWYVRNNSVHVINNLFIGLFPLACRQNWNCL